MENLKRKLLKKRIIQKRRGSKQETTEILFIEEEGKSPETIVTVEEINLPEEISEITPTYIVEELPEEIVTETVAVDGKPKKDNY
ncbi:hypothetical protein NQ318_016821 [Aromia moschata]|uniref:Uncharacterized protein n=1 Tax=Aromia moschata TaxID=1265417 RepID=A0AAV8YT68_9CUCU|nr:hypothetical protein NQ318_016821 [Aromia moschata]